MLSMIIVLGGRICLADNEIAIQSALVKLAEYAEATALAAGPLATVEVVEGTEVRRGMVLAQLVDNEQQLAIEQAELAHQAAQRLAENRVPRDAAEQALTIAREELRRAKEAVAKIPDTISQTEMDRLALAVDQALLGVRKAEQEQVLADLEVQQKHADLRAARLQRERRSIVAPLDGIVVRIDLKPGEWVEPGKKVVRIAHLDVLRVEGVLDATVAASLPPQAEAEFRTQRTNVSLTGRVVFVSPEVDPFTQQVRVIANVKNEKREVRPGEIGTLIILGGKEPRPSTVPSP
jgi:multidrug efflux pump subunit AcrA (membrane-fusion protein)